MFTSNFQATNHFFSAEYLGIPLVTTTTTTTESVTPAAAASTEILDGDTVLIIILVSVFGFLLLAMIFGFYYYWFSVKIPKSVNWFFFLPTFNCFEIYVTYVWRKYTDLHYVN